MKTRAEIYCELLNELSCLNELAALKESSLYTTHKEYQIKADHLAAVVTSFLLTDFDEIDVIIWNEKTQKFEVRK